eukprot:TRINITY_DN25306_c0_g1_i1.p1 TRINITY_DN25306_c0_g1~~TRINITY_DN25306_c0_g1_i1.p1  ORF type:complete len:196 (-),score=18.21 TRINITY_DN25306_c0_g1_i1:351-881(-)
MRETSVVDPETRTGEEVASDEDGAGTQESDSDGDDQTAGLAAKTFKRTIEDFTCGHCGHLERGNGYTNHCSQCLWSKHVDVNPGDRAATCRGLMAPVGVDTKNGEYRIFQRCEECGHERWNRRQEQDDFDMILKISAGVSDDLNGGKNGKNGKGGKGYNKPKGSHKGRGKSRGKGR